MLKELWGSKIDQVLMRYKQTRRSCLRHLDDSGEHRRLLTLPQRRNHRRRAPEYVTRMRTLRGFAGLGTDRIHGQQSESIYQMISGNRHC